VTWVAWRLQRTETLIACALLLLVAAVLVPTGIEIGHAFDRDNLAACLGAHPSDVCNNAIGGFLSRFNSLDDLLGWFTLLPGLVGVILAAPFLLELEQGTYRLAWTQSITRGRWIAAKLGLPLAVALLVGGAYILIGTWWRAPFVRLNGRMDTATYDSEGTVALAYALFAFGLALAVGVLWRRAVAAVTVAFVGYVAARVFVDTWLRDRLVTPLTVSWNSASEEPAALRHARIISQYGSGFRKILLGGHGKVAVPSQPGVRVTLHALYQPARDFWPLQGIESAIYAGIALVLILFAAWWTHQRTA